jgi:hypothetical protein
MCSLRCRMKMNSLVISRELPLKLWLPRKTWLLIFFWWCRTGSLLSLRLPMISTRQKKEGGITFASKSLIKTHKLFNIHVQVCISSTVTIFTSTRSHHALHVSTYSFLHVHLLFPTYVHLTSYMPYQHVYPCLSHMFTLLLTCSSSMLPMPISFYYPHVSLVTYMR